MGSRAARRKSRRRLHRRPGTALQRHGWRAQLPQGRTCSRDPLGEKSRGLAQDQVLVLEPLHLALEAQHLGFIRLLLGERLSRASGQLLIAPLAQLARADIQFSGDIGQRPATLDQALNRLGLILTGKPSPGSSVCPSALLGCSGSFQNPPLRRGKPTAKELENAHERIETLEARLRACEAREKQAEARAKDAEEWLRRIHDAIAEELPSSVSLLA